MTSKPLMCAFVLIFFSNVSAAAEDNDGSLAWATAHLKYEDHSLQAKRKSPTYPELVRANADGSCDFRFYQPTSDNPADGYFKSSARPGETIDGGTSDYYGFLVSCDSKRQEAVVRDFYLE
jgi:hypothetical protein